MQDADTAIQHSAAEAAEAARPTPLPLRDDTLLGVCEAIGEDFGVPANLLRIALAAGLLWNVEAIIAIYLGLGVAVAASRLLFPKPRAVPAAIEPANSEHRELETERLAA